jgi:hypothetical protein
MSGERQLGRRKQARHFGEACAQFRIQLLQLALDGRQRVVEGARLALGVFGRLSQCLVGGRLHQRVELANLAA